MKSALYFAALVVALADTSTNTQVLENKQVPILSVEPPHELQVLTLPVENDDAFSIQPFLRSFRRSNFNKCYD